MQIDHVYITFSSGRRIHVAEGMIGISPDGDGFIGAGYDDRIDELTRDERIELADTMIAAWTHYRDAQV